MWTPDAYEGAPAVVTGFMSTGVKAAAFAAFARVFLSAFEPFSADWAPMVWVLAAATMILGTVVGVAQSNLKRMLAYSSIAHGGYLLVGLVAANEVGKAAILFYLLAYAITNLAAFGVIALLGTRDRPTTNCGTMPACGTRAPALAALMTVCLLSLGGLPPTVGFIGKWYIFSAAVSAGYYGLAIIGVLTSVVSVFFYLRVVVMMYMADATRHWRRPPRIAGVGMAALVASIAAIFYLGILPTPGPRTSPPNRSPRFSDQRASARTQYRCHESGTRRCVPRSPMWQNDREWPTQLRTSSARSTVLEAELKRLEAEYNMFFAGRLPRPPWETRARVDGAGQAPRSHSTSPTTASASASRRCRPAYAQVHRSVGSRAAGARRRTARVRSRSREDCGDAAEAGPKDRVVCVTTFSDPMQRNGARCRSSTNSLAEARRESGQEANSVPQVRRDGQDAGGRAQGEGQRRGRVPRGGEGRKGRVYRARRCEEQLKSEE